MRPTILTVLGTRPEVVKLAPVLDALKGRDATSVLCSTKQQAHLLQPMLDLFGLRPDYELPHFDGDDASRLSGLTAHLLNFLAPVISMVKPDVVVVQGDTTTALCGALAAFYQHVTVAHVEAGLRTSSIAQPFPEELNRRLISRIATLHFAPTKHACWNLSRESIQGRVVRTGNTVVDSLRRILSSECTPDAREIWGAVEDGKLLLVTCHRRETWGAALDDLLTALRRTALERDDIFIVWPVHGNPQLAERVKKGIRGWPNVLVEPPLDYPTFVHLLNRADVVVTDSGGVLEEAATLGVPTIVIRDETERPEALDYDRVRILPLEKFVELPEMIVKLLDRGFEKKESTIFGKGDAGERITEILMSFLGTRYT